ncbi:chymotrypsin inhibitor SCI-II [Drosophila ficusphila]|uniref:chymotrypsin inhibitor SCI-II n=1 Tax=Drosophila ficusphila TaxID=30025 RepID=UPI0007E7D9B8|nr:chymotrypsin inhibitor SCI-II [Drosophila ficusphila]
MKYFAVFALLFCILATAMAQLKNPICGEEFGKLGNCRAQLRKWTYRRDTNKCIEFSYSGCHGNNNLFDDQAQCEKTCKV